MWTSACEGNPILTSSFPIKTRVIRLPGTAQANVPNVVQAILQWLKPSCIIYVQHHQKKTTVCLVFGRCFFFLWSSSTVVFFTNRSIIQAEDQLLMIQRLTSISIASCLNTAQVASPFTIPRLPFLHNHLDASAPVNLGFRPKSLALRAALASVRLPNPFWGEAGEATS